MEIKNRKLFKELVKKLTLELLDEESLEEISTTAGVDGYSTPFAFSSKEDEKKKKKRLKKKIRFQIKILENCAGTMLFSKLKDKKMILKG